MDDAGSAQLAKVLSEDYESNAGDYASLYVKDLVVRTFSPLATTAGSKVDYQREVENTTLISRSIPKRKRTLWNA